MKNKDLTVAILIGSIRKDRQSIKPAKAIIALLKEHGVKPIVLDLQTLALPAFDGETTNVNVNVKKVLNTYKKMDGIIIISPEYDHSVPSAVVNALEHARLKELLNKPMSAVCVSAGLWGGMRALPALRQMWLGVGGVALPTFLPVPFVETFTADEEWKNCANVFLSNTLKLFRIIKKGMSFEK